MQAPEKIRTNAATSLSEYDASTKTVQRYVNGGKSGETAEMKKAFHNRCDDLG